MKEDLKNLVWMDDDQLADVFQESRIKQDVGILDNSVMRTDSVRRSSRATSDPLGDQTPSLGSDGSRRRESDITTTSEGSGFQ